MRSLFRIGIYGRKNIVARHGKCTACRKPAVLSSYVSTRFFDFYMISLFPLGSIYVVDACPLCGFKTTITDKKHRKQRKKDLAKMMKGFSKKSKDPDAVLNALHTLMVYNEETWFMNVKTSYGLQFDTHMQIQYVIAQGLCRFGKYTEAITYCHKAVALGAGDKGAELLNLCQTLKERNDTHPVEKARVKPESTLRRYAFLISSSILSIFVATVVGVLITFSHCAWLVNGTPVEYSVRVDGKRYKLDEYERRRIIIFRLPEHHVKIEGLPGLTTPVSFEYAHSLLDQLTEHHALVLNPDRMAILVSETIDGGQPDVQYRYGHTINALTNVPYAFTAFPEDAFNSQSAITRVYQHTPASHLDAMDFLSANVHGTDVLQYARQILELKPTGSETPALLEAVVNECTTEEAYELIQPGLEFIPPLMDWHLFYQAYAAKHDPDRDLKTEYALLCEKYPDVPEYYYLLGRQVKEMEKAHLLFKKSEDGRGSNGLGFYTIARELLCSGRFKDALHDVEQALDKNPDNPDFEQLYTRILIACKKYTQLLHLAHKNMANDPGNGELVAEEIRYLTLLGELQASQDAASRFPDPNGLWNPYFSSVRFYATGNVTNYLGALVTAERPEAQLQELLHSGKVQEAYELVVEDPKSTYLDFLLLYSAALYHDLPSVAKSALTKAAVSFDETDVQQQAIKVMLLGRRKPTTQELLDLCIWPEEKAILCTALGFRFPSHNKNLFRMADLFNHRPEYPQLLLKKWLQQPADTP